MAIYRITVRWSGFTGAPGYTNLHFGDLASGDGARDGWERSLAFFNEFNDLLPNDVTWLVEGEAAVLDEQTGQIVDYQTVSENPLPGTGGSPGGYSAASGAVITWNTAGVRNGRRVRGRTFLVPLGGGAYENDGTLSPSTISTLNSAAQELTGEGFDSSFGVFSRPSNGSDGGFYEVTGFRVPDMSAVLRSRRD